MVRAPSMAGACSSGLAVCRALSTWACTRVDDGSSPASAADPPAYPPPPTGAPAGAATAVSGTPPPPCASSGAHPTSAIGASEGRVVKGFGVGEIPTCGEDGVSDETA